MKQNKMLQQFHNSNGGIYFTAAFVFILQHVREVFSVLTYAADYTRPELECSVQTFKRMDQMNLDNKFHAL